MVKRVIACVAAMLMLMQSAVLAGELYSVETRQIYCFSDIMRTYIDAEDQFSSPIAKPASSNVAGFIDGERLTVKNIERFGDTNEGTADIFLVDISGSINNSQMLQVKSAIRTWAQQMKENDRIAIVTFGESAQTIADFTGDREEIYSALDSITNNDRNTMLYGGISHSLKLASRGDKDLPKRRNIILITDGVNDYSGGISEEDVYAELRRSLVPVYSMQVSSSKKGRATLNSVTEYSGGELYDISSNSIDAVYGWIRNDILDTYTIDFSYDGIQPDNNTHNFTLKLAEGTKIVEDSVYFILKSNEESSQTYGAASVEPQNTASEDASNEEENKDKETDVLTVVLIVAGILLIAAIATAVALAMKKDTRISQSSRGGGYDEEYSQNSLYSQPTTNQWNTDASEKTAKAGAYTMGAREAIVFRSSVSGETKRMHLCGKKILGRSDSCDLTFAAPTISSRHASITLEGGKVYLEDLASSNGTLVNGRLITSKIEIKDGDMLMLGSEEYKISICF